MTYSLDTLTTPGGRTSPASPPLTRGAREALLFLGAGVLLFWIGALLSHSLADAAWSTTGHGGSTRNLGGRAGAWIADLSYFLLGYSVWWCVLAAMVACARRLWAVLREADAPHAAAAARIKWALPALLLLLVARAGVRRLLGAPDPAT